MKRVVAAGWRRTLIRTLVALVVGGILVLGVSLSQEWQGLRVAPIGSDRLAAGASASSEPQGSRLAAPRSYGKAGFRLDVPPSSATPRLTAEQAFAVCVRNVAPCLDEAVVGSAVRELAVFSDDTYGPIPAKGAKFIPSYENVLAWIFTYHGVPSGPGGRAYGIGEVPVQFTPPPCDFMIVVDANSGKYLLGLQACRGLVRPGATHHLIAIKPTRPPGVGGTSRGGAVPNHELPERPRRGPRSSY